MRGYLYYYEIIHLPIINIDYNNIDYRIIHYIHINEGGVINK